MKKVFVTVGSQKFQFNRLINELDKISGHRKDIEIYAQIGYSTYKPVNFVYTEFLDSSEFNKQIESSDLVICHSGTGVIIRSLELSKPVICVPRRKRYGEHVDDHQTEIATLFASQNYLINCDDISNLNDLIDKAFSHRFSSFHSNTNEFVKGLIDIIER